MQAEITPIYKKSGPSKANLKAWFDASRMASIVFSGANNVSQWSDLSGDGNHATQPTNPNQPTYSYKQLNFGSGLSLQTPNINFGVYTAFIVGYCADDTHNLFFARFVAPGNTYDGFLNSSHSLIVGRGVGRELIKNLPSSIAGKQSIFRLQFDGSVAGLKAYSGNTQLPSNITLNTGTPGTGLKNLPVFFGFNSNFGTYLNGYINEVLLYDSVLSDAECLKNTAYLAKKWGISI